MKTIYFIQTFNLPSGIITNGKIAYSSIDDAREHIKLVKRIASESEHLTLEEIDKKYVYNIQTLEMF